MKQIAIVAALAAVFAAPCPALSEQAEKFDPAARAKAIAPFMDGSDLLIAHIDLRRVDAKAVVDTFIRPVISKGLRKVKQAVQLKVITTRLNGLVTGLRQANG